MTQNNINSDHTIIKIIVFILLEYKIHRNRINFIVILTFK